LIGSSGSRLRELSCLTAAAGAAGGGGQREADRKKEVKTHYELMDFQVMCVSACLGQTRPNNPTKPSPQ